MGHIPFENFVARQALWLIQREVWLKRHGLAECESCRSWVRDTHEAASFHFRRCEG